MTAMVTLTVSPENIGDTTMLTACDMQYEEERLIQQVECTTTH